MGFSKDLLAGPVCHTVDNIQTCLAFAVFQNLNWRVRFTSVAESFISNPLGFNSTEMRIPCCLCPFQVADQRRQQQSICLSVPLWQLHSTVRRPRKTAMQGGSSMHDQLHILEACSKLCLVATLTVTTTPAAPAMLTHLAVLGPLLASAQQLTLWAACLPLGYANFIPLNACLMSLLTDTPPILAGIGILQLYNLGFLMVLLHNTIQHEVFG